MKLLLRKVAAAVALVAALPAAQADVLNFDDLNSFGFFSAPYQGFSFGTLDSKTGAWLYDNVSTAPFVSKSPLSHVATDFHLYTPGNLWEDAQAITSPVDFKFDGAWFSGYNKVKFKLYLNGGLVFTSGESAELSATPAFLASGYTGLVDAVVVSGEQGYYAMDDFTYNTAVVPEPSTYALMALGLCAVGFVANRRRRG